MHVYYYNEVKRVVNDKTIDIETKGALKGAIIDGTDGIIVGSNVGKKLLQLQNIIF